MGNTLYRIRNCFSLSNIIACSVGGGLAMVGIYAPIGWDVPPEKAQILTFVGLGLIGIGLVLAVYNYISNPIEKKERIFTIITILDRMYKQLIKLTQKESDIVNAQKFVITSSKISNLAGVRVPKVTSTDEAKRAIEELEGRLPSILPADKKREQKIKWMHSVSLLLDRDGFGLKNKRSGDKKYKQLLDMVEKYYDDYKEIIDDNLRVLIRSHIDFAESGANTILFKKRFNRILLTASELGVPNLLTPSMESDLEGVDREIQEISRKIRVEIGQHIKELITQNGQQNKF